MRKHGDTTDTSDTSDTNDTNDTNLPNLIGNTLAFPPAQYNTPKSNESRRRPPARTTVRFILAGGRLAINWL